MLVVDMLKCPRHPGEEGGGGALMFPMDLFLLLPQRKLPVT